MKVKELIEYLKELPQDYDVHVIRRLDVGCEPFIPEVDPHGDPIVEF